MAEADRAKRNAAEGFWLRIIYIVFALICATGAFLILGPRPNGTAGKLDVSTLPTVNAALNAVTAVLLCAGYVFIRRHKVTVHKRLMLTAFFTSSAFLASYVIYHDPAERNAANHRASTQRRETPSSAKRAERRGRE